MKVCPENVAAKFTAKKHSVRFHCLVLAQTTNASRVTKPSPPKPKASLRNHRFSHSFPPSAKMVTLVALHRCPLGYTVHFQTSCGQLAPLVLGQSWPDFHLPHLPRHRSSPPRCTDSHRLGSSSPDLACDSGGTKVALRL